MKFCCSLNLISIPFIYVKRERDRLTYIYIYIYIRSLASYQQRMSCKRKPEHDQYICTFLANNSSSSILFNQCTRLLIIIYIYIWHVYVCICVWSVGDGVTKKKPMVPMREYDKNVMTSTMSSSLKVQSRRVRKI